MRADVWVPRASSGFRTKGSMHTKNGPPHLPFLRDLATQTEALPRNPPSSRLPSASLLRFQPWSYLNYLKVLLQFSCDPRDGNQPPPQKRGPETRPAEVPQKVPRNFNLALQFFIGPFHLLIFRPYNPLWRSSAPVSPPLDSNVSMVCLARKDRGRGYVQ